MRRRIACQLLVLVLLGINHSAAVAGQTGEPQFEIASVKPNTSGDFQRAELSIRPGGHFIAVNVPLSELVQLAYGVTDFQVINAPDWIRDARFDVNAKASQELKPGTPPAELRALLTNRFGLKSHRDTREMPVYKLVLADPGAALGPALRRSPTDECAQAQKVPSSSPSPPTQPAARQRCVFRVGRGSMVAASMSMATLADRLKGVVGRFVTDETGLGGVYDFELLWRADDTSASAPADSSNPSLFAALQEQLGLKLDAARAPIEVLVIDHVQRPDPD